MQIRVAVGCPHLTCLSDLLLRRTGHARVCRDRHCHSVALNTQHSHRVALQPRTTGDHCLSPSFLVLPPRSPVKQSRSPLPVHHVASNCITQLKSLTWGRCVRHRARRRVAAQPDRDVMNSVLAPNSQRRKRQPLQDGLCALQVVVYNQV